MSILRINSARQQPELSPSVEAELLAQLAALGARWPIAIFLRIRRSARVNHQQLDRLRRLIGKAKRGRDGLGANPFNLHRVAALDAAIVEMSATRDWVRETQQEIGRSLLDLAPAVDGITTLDERLELLNCNPADRADLYKLNDPDLGMVHLIAVYCVEDSAEHRDDEWNDRPLHAAVNAEMHRVMFNTPEGRVASDKLFDGLFAPGGLFEGVPTYYRQPDGTMLRKAPSLTVHDATGSRVVERSPS